LSPEIKRGKSCTSILVVPQRKPSFVELFHGVAMPQLKLHGRPWKACRERKGRGRVEEQGARPLAMERRKGAHGGATQESLIMVLLLCAPFSVALREEEKKGREREKEDKERKEKRKKTKPENFWGEKR
jgi:hypothetical protein